MVVVGPAAARGRLVEIIPGARLICILGLKDTYIYHLPYTATPQASPTGVTPCVPPLTDAADHLAIDIAIGVQCSFFTDVVEIQTRENRGFSKI